MSRSTGLLLVLDAQGGVFSRLWCCTEEFLAMADRGSSTAPALIDISAVHETGATLLADGLTAEDGPGGSAWMQKIARERAFPTQLLQHSLGIDVEMALTTVAAERQQLLSALAKSADVHPGIVSQQLRLTFATVAWRQAIEKDLASLRRDVLKVISNEKEQRSLALNFAGQTSSFQDTHLTEVAGVLSPSLRSLELGFYACTQITNAGIMALGRSLPKSLERLRLDCWWCQNIGDWGVRGLAQGFRQGLRDLALSFEDCHQIGNEGVSWLSERLPATLVALELNFWNCTRIDDTGVCQLAADLPAGLASLSLVFYCWGADERSGGVSDRGVMALAKALPPGLKQLSLAFVFCQGVTDTGVEGLIAALPQGLERLSLDFRGCSKIDKSKQKIEQSGDSMPKSMKQSVGTRMEAGKAVDQKSKMVAAVATGPRMARIADMFRRVDALATGNIQRKHLFRLLQLLYPGLLEQQFDVMLRCAGLPLEDSVIPYEKLLTWIYEGM
jgi:hypothetical protein